MFQTPDLKQAVNEAMAEFGRYNYYDKGAVEVMNLNPYVLKIKTSSVEELKAISAQLGEFSEWEHAGPLLTDLLTGSQALSEEKFDALVSDERVLDYY